MLVAVHPDIGGHLHALAHRAAHGKAAVIGRRGQVLDGRARRLHGGGQVAVDGLAAIAATDTRGGPCARRSPAALRQKADIGRRQRDGGAGGRRQLAASRMPPGPPSARLQRGGGLPRGARSARSAPNKLARSGRVQHHGQRGLRPPEPFARWRGRAGQHSEGRIRAADLPDRDGRLAEVARGQPGVALDPVRGSGRRGHRRCRQDVHRTALAARCRDGRCCYGRYLGRRSRAPAGTIIPSPMAAAVHNARRAASTSVPSGASAGAASTRPKSRRRAISSVSHALR